MALKSRVNELADSAGADEDAFEALVLVVPVALELELAAPEPPEAELELELEPQALTPSVAARARQAIAALLFTSGN